MLFKVGVLVSQSNGIPSASLVSGEAVAYLGGGTENTLWAADFALAIFLTIVGLVSDGLVLKRWTRKYCCQIVPAGNSTNTAKINAAG